MVLQQPLQLLLDLSRSGFPNVVCSFALLQYKSMLLNVVVKEKSVMSHEQMLKLICSFTPVDKAADIDI